LNAMMLSLNDEDKREIGQVWLCSFWRIIDQTSENYSTSSSVFMDIR